MYMYIVQHCTLHCTVQAVHDNCGFAFITWRQLELHRPSMDLQTANIALKAGLEAATGLGGKFCLAVLDAGVNLVAFNRMDGGRVGTIDVAIKKVVHRWRHL